jgi:hypothetical protein
MVKAVDVLSGEVCFWCGCGKHLRVFSCEHGVSVVLCGRCALWASRGYVLCKGCKKHYHRADRSMCWSCEDAESERLGEAEEDDDPYDSVDNWLNGRGF